MENASPYVPPSAGNVVKLQEDLKVASLHWLIEELARQCPEFASYQLLKKQDWVQRAMYQKSGKFGIRLQRMESRHRMLDITVDRQNTPYADMDAVDISVRAMKCTERILNTSRDSLSARARAREHDQYPTWPVALDLNRDSETKWKLVHNLVEMCSHNFSGSKILDISKEPIDRRATTMQANVRAFEQAVGWRAQDTLLTAYGQAELQTQLQAQQQAQLQAQQLAQLQAQHQAQQQAQQHSPQQAEQNSQQQGQQEARQKSQRQTWLSDRHAVPFAPELPDADGRYPNLVVEFQPVDLTEDDPPGPDEPILTTTWSECHDFQAMEALLHKIYCSDKTQSNIHYVTATRRKDSWLSLDRVSDEKQLQVYARLSIIQKRSLQIAAFYVPPGE